LNELRAAQVYRGEGIHREPESVLRDIEAIRAVLDNLDMDADYDLFCLRAQHRETLEAIAPGKLTAAAALARLDGEDEDEDATTRPRWAPGRAVAPGPAPCALLRALSGRARVGQAAQPPANAATDTLRWAMFRCMSNRKHSTPADSPLLPPPCAPTVLSHFDDTAEWLHDTCGGPLLALPASARRRLEAMDITASAPEPEGTQYAIMSLLQSIAERGRMLRERGRTAYELPAEARDVLLAFMWGEPVQRDILRRAADAARELESKLAWRTLAMPLRYIDRAERGILERMNGWN
jgi:hypothetical protein